MIGGLGLSLRHRARDPGGRLVAADEWTRVLARGERTAETRTPAAAPESRAQAAPPAPTGFATATAGEAAPSPSARAADPLARLLARAVAERADAAAGEVGGLTDLVEELSVAIAARDNAKVHYTLKIEAFRLDQIMERFKERKGRTLRQALLAANMQGEYRDKELVRALAVLHGGPDGEYEPWAQMGLALIPLGTRDIDLMRLLEERKLPQRRQLKADYDNAFRGIGKTSGDTLEEHLVSDMSGWERQKALALLDHELTPADHLALVTIAIRGAHDETALEILQHVWREGPAAFAKLHADWQRFVQGPGFTKLALREAIEDELGGVHLEAAQAILAQYDAVRANAQDGGDTVEWADIRVQEWTIASALRSGVFTSAGNLVAAAAGDLRKAWAKRAKHDPRAASEWKARRAQLSQLFADHGGLRGADMVEARIQLVRDPTPVDRIYLASMRREYAKALDTATESWQAGTESDLDRQLRHPPAGDPRPALAVDELAIPLNQDASDAYVALTNAKLTHAERGAVRLQLALQGGGRTTKAANLDAAYKFLKAIKDKGQRTAVIEAYVARYLDDAARRHGNAVLVDSAAAPGDAVARFCRALQTDATGFEQSPTMIDLLHLLAPATALSDALALANRRDRATHTGLLDVYSTGLVSTYDALTGEDTQEVADDALSRLRRWVRAANAAPDELKAVMEAEGVTEVSALANLGYERFSVRLDEVRSVKASVAEGVGMFVDFAGRSLLVAVLGPAGLPGLLAALGSYTAGMLVREGLLGVEYQLESVQNLSTLIAEAATFGFDELLIENVIKELVPTGAAAGRIFGAQGLSGAGEVRAGVPQGIGREALREGRAEHGRGLELPDRRPAAGPRRARVRCGRAQGAEHEAPDCAERLHADGGALPREPQEDHPQRPAAEGRARLRDGQGADRHVRVGGLGQHDARAEARARHEDGPDLGRERRAGVRGVHEPRRAGGGAREEAREVAARRVLRAPAGGPGAGRRVRHVRAGREGPAVAGSQGEELHAVGRRPDRARPRQASGERDQEHGRGHDPARDAALEPLRPVTRSCACPRARAPRRRARRDRRRRRPSCAS